MGDKKKGCCQITLCRCGFFGVLAILLLVLVVSMSFIIVGPTAKCPGLFSLCDVYKHGECFCLHPCDPNQIRTNCTKLFYTFEVLCSCENSPEVVREIKPIMATESSPEYPLQPKADSHGSHSHSASAEGTPVRKSDEVDASSLVPASLPPVVTTVPDVIEASEASDITTEASNNTQVELS